MVRCGTDLASASSWEEPIETAALRRSRHVHTHVTKGFSVDTLALKTVTLAPAPLAPPKSFAHAGATPTPSKLPALKSSTTPSTKLPNSHPSARASAKLSNPANDTPAIPSAALTPQPPTTAILFVARPSNAVNTPASTHVATLGLAIRVSKASVSQTSLVHAASHLSHPQSPVVLIPSLLALTPVEKPCSAVTSAIQPTPVILIPKPARPALSLSKDPVHVEAK
ncbi:hypothetical protein HDV05_001710 [Chytridiales sp. JEL 0842]|nr:hypothetical protein HDV05_001710 [Chytridiales sp. JEL 0842]